MNVGLIIAVLGSLIGFAGSLSIPWVDDEVVKLPEAAGYAGYEWWPALIAFAAMAAALAFAVVGLKMHRKKLFALAGLILTAVVLVFVVLTPFIIRGEYITYLQEALKSATLKGAIDELNHQLSSGVAMYYGFHAAFLGMAIMSLGFIWTLGAQPILGPEDRLLRVALLWKGKLIKETTFTEKRDITIGEGVRSDFVVPAQDMKQEYGKVYPLFRVDPKGNYSVALQREMRGRVCLENHVASVAEYVKKYTADASGSNLVPVSKGDWGVIEFGDVELFFQFVRPDVIIGRRPAMAMDGVIIAATISAMFVIGAFFVASMFIWNPAGAVERHKADKRLLKVEANIAQEKDEKLLEIGEEEDDVGKKAEGEEGKFGDPDKDPTLESKVPRRDGMMASKIDPKKIGLADLLSNKMAKSGAISSILSDNADAFDNRMAVAMAGTGSELVVGYGAGGMGFKGTGPGGGGTGGYGRIHGLGQVDTGGGMGMRAGLGKKKAASVGKMSLGGMGAQGFCQRNNIQSVVMQRAGAIRACYEAQLQIHEGLAGKISVRWTITTEGGVEGAAITENSMGNTAVQECVLRAIRHMRFAKPEGGICIVAWPFVFNPG